MFQDKLADLQRRHDVPAALLADIDTLLGEVATRASVLGSLAEAFPTVTLAASEGPPVMAGAPAEVELTDRYEDLGLLGAGGMGEVRRVRDLDLNRTMAMKTLRPELLERPEALARFIEEAQCSAQLQHPGIVPVHELGRLPDGRVYFTMREVRGRSLSEVIAEVHGAVRGDRWARSAGGWSFRGLVDAFHRVCEAVAYAHGRGVVHRDLKPENVMLGGHGEVLVVDWGLAKVAGERDRALEAGELEPVVTDRSQDTSQATQLGAVAGTPAYMPPEQARGEVDAIDARSDVYALGAVLYEVLSGRAPYRGDDAMAVLVKVLVGPPEPPGRGVALAQTLGFLEGPAAAPSGPPLPEELVAACVKAMARAPGERFADAGELAAEVGAWLDGARLREQALEVVGAAEARSPEVEALRGRAGRLEAEAEGLLAEVASHAPEAEKAPGWALEDEAASLRREAERRDLEVEQGLYAGLRIDPTLPEAHAALAERHRGALAAAEAARDPDAEARAAFLLGVHAEALPESHGVRQRCAAYLKGDGALTLVTDPPGAEVLLHRYETQNRRLVPVFERSLGPAPLTTVSLPKGSYLCVLRAEGRPDVRYPVHIERGAHWDGVPPGDTAPHPIRLPGPEELGQGDCYVPAGWFVSGGDPEAVGSLPQRRLWADRLVMRRFPVTNREYIEFLDDLVASGREEEALRHVPRERVGHGGELGAMAYGRDDQGRFELVVDADGDAWLPDLPVCLVDWWGAAAYSEWLAARTGAPWRLPGELEWEKTARGADGRFFPWGDATDPSWCCMRESHAGRPLPAVVDSYPVDESPYGVRGLGGNMRDWCADVYEPGGPASAGGRVSRPERVRGRDPRVLRGGSWFMSAGLLRAAFRRADEPDLRYYLLGFRVARSSP